MNVLLATGNGFGALIAQKQIEGKVKERDAVGLELTRRVSQKTQKKQGGGFGSGFFITSDGYFVTCSHVVSDAARIEVKTKTGIFPARVVREDPANDVAVLKLEGTFQPLAIISSGITKLGESVFTIGFPKPDKQGFEPKFTRGDVSSLTGLRDNPQDFQISVPVQPGNSGGPLINKAGAVIGVVASKRNESLQSTRNSAELPENVNYAVKSSHVLTMLESVPGLLGQLENAHPTSQLNEESIIERVQNGIGLVIVYGETPK